MLYECNYHAHFSIEMLFNKCNTTITSLKIIFEKTFDYLCKVL